MLCIFGIGSPSGDDQAGWLTIDALLASGIQPGQGVVIEKLDRPGANLIARMENVAWVILIDAMQSDGPAGRIQRFDHMDWPGYRHGYSSHGFGVLEALLLGQELGGLPPRLDVYGIGIAAVKPGDAPGEAVQAAARKLARVIVKQCAAWRDLTASDEINS